METTPSSTGESSNVQTTSQGTTRIPTPYTKGNSRLFHRFHHLSSRPIPEPRLCIEVNLTIFSWYLSTSHTSPGYLEVMFLAPKASLDRWGLVHQGLHPWVPPDTSCIQSLQGGPGGPTGRWVHVSYSGCSWLGPMC